VDWCVQNAEKAKKSALDQGHARAQSVVRGRDRRCGGSAGRVGRLVSRGGSSLSTSCQRTIRRREARGRGALRGGALRAEG